MTTTDERSPILETTKNATLSKILLDYLQLGSTMMVSNFALFLNIYLGNLMIAKEGGKNVLAAAGLISVVRNQTFALGTPILFAGGILAGRKKQALKKSENKEETQKTQINQSIDDIFRANVAVAFIYGACSSIILGNFTYLILKGLKQNHDKAKVAQSFFTTFSYGLTPNFIRIALQQFLLGLSKKSIVLASNLFNALVSIGLSYLFVFGNATLDLSKMGVSGLGLANSIGATLTLFFLVAAIKCDKKLKDNQFFSCKLPTWQQLKTLLKIGLPIGFQIALEFLAQTICTLIVGYKDSDTLAGLQAAVLNANILFIPPSNLTQSAGILVSQALEKKDRKNAYRYGNTGIILGVSLAILEFFLILAISKPLITLFLSSKNADDNNIRTTGMYFLYILGGTNILESLAKNIAGAMRGYKSTKGPMIASLLSLLLVAMPIGYIFDQESDLTIFSYFVALGISKVFPIISNGYQWQHLNKNTPEKKTDKKQNDKLETREETPLLNESKTIFPPSSSNDENTTFQELKTAILSKP